MTSSNAASVVDQALRTALAVQASRTGRGTRRAGRSRVMPPGEEPILAVVGPTATGKTALAVALAERLGGEIVGADSVQIYTRFDVGSGKPTPDEVARARHHLVGQVDPLVHVDAAGWAEQAERVIADIRQRGHVPILCGGTFLWVKALLYGLAATPAANTEIRLRHRDIAQRDGRPLLHEQLRAVDPEAAARLHPNDFVRVSRALEVQELSGKPMSQWQREHGFREALHDARLIAIAHDPGALTERITSRVRQWLASGWIEEVEGLIADGYGEARAMGSVGYAQVRAMLRGEIAREELQASIVRATRVFARRQRTWLNHADVTWVG
jgi:tRNA dimethylallyltransferase